MFNGEQLDMALYTSVLTNTRFQQSAISFLRDRNNHNTPMSAGQRTGDAVLDLALHYFQHALVC